jgi:hypothetical protein
MRFTPAVFAVMMATVASAQVQPKITANDLKADVSFLASDALEGRGTPSKGLDIAAEYIASEFRRAGLEPAGGDGYFQTAPYASVTPNSEGLELTLETGDRFIKAENASMGLQEAAAADLSHVPAVKATMTDAAALDALTPDQVRGKVLLLMIPPDTPYSATRGIPDAVVRLEPALVLSVRTHGRGLSAGPRLRDTSAPGAKVPILAVWDDAIQTAVAAAEEIKVSAHIPAPVGQPVKLRNVIGVLRGSDPALKDTYLVLTAHYDHLGVRGTGDGDHIYNGANDDASGTSSVVEIAKALASLPQRPRRSIVFLTLFGEELGDLGSRYYCQHPVFPLAKTVADINLEQLGRTDDTEGPRPLQFNLTGFDYSDIAAFLSKAGERTGIRVVKHEQNSDSFFGRSDNAAFAEAGVPSTTLSVGYIFPDYHRPGDEWLKLDYDNMAKVDGAVALGVYGIADSAEAPRWNKNNPKTARYVAARDKQ